MQIINTLKDKTISNFLIPVTQKYIRYAPFKTGKLFLWNFLNWRENTYVTQTFFGSKMRTRTNDQVQGYIYYFGIWEPNLTNFIKNRLDGLKGRTFVDVGANVGYYSLLAAECMPQGNVVSIEAFPSIYEKLVENIELNKYGNVRTINCAATDIARDISMYHAGPENEGATTSRKGKFNTEPVVVKGFPLSDILTTEEVSNTRMVKIDVEGAEYTVLKGIYPLLDKFPEDAEIIVEITPLYLKESEMAEIFETFRDAGFNPYTLHNSYDPEYYIFSQETYEALRLKAYPDKPVDVVFSRIESDSLAL